MSYGRMEVYDIGRCVARCCVGLADFDSDGIGQSPSRV